MNYQIYCDGSCRGNGTQQSAGAYGFVIYDGDKRVVEYVNSVNDTTNQRMELMACISSLDFITSQSNYMAADTKIDVFTDSAYLHNCIIQKWYINWLKNGWVNAKKQPVANSDLWKRLIPYFNDTKISFNKVKGHADNEKNNYVDMLVQKASQRLKNEKFNSNSTSL